MMFGATQHLTESERTMNEISVVGVDLGKSVIHVHGADARGKPLFQRAMRRNGFERFMAKLAPCTVGMEACSGAHHWARVLRRHGHEVRLLPARYARAYVKTNKNDWRDAEALVEAMSRPTMRYVPEKDIEAQAWQMVHRVRSRLVRQRSAVANQARGFLAEFGVVFAPGLGTLRRRLPQVVEEAANELPGRARGLLWGLYEELRALDERVAALDEELEAHGREEPLCQRLREVPGIGVVTASALVAAVGDARQFASGRDLAAWLGLVPKQYSTGGRTVLGGISKRGDRYVRTLLIHGARAALARVNERSDPRLRWAEALRARRGHNIAVVALANKLARAAWVVLSREERYRAAAAG
jgi:transposase